MTRKMLIDAAHPEEVRVCVLENGKVEDFDFESSTRKPLRGNIYLARVTRVEPSLQAAFVEYGGNRHGFLAFSEIHPDYYQIPVSDRRLLQEAEAEEAALASQLELEQRGDFETDEIDAEDGEIEAQNSSADEAEDDDEDPSFDSGDAVDAAPDSAEDEETAAEADADVSTDSANEEDNDAAEEARESDAEASAADDAEENEGGERSASDEADRTSDDVESEGKETTGRSRGSKRQALLEQYREARRKRARIVRNYKIQEVIKRRQILLVQVVKEERGNKGAALTTYLSLAGRYCVLMPNTARGGGISRKIPNAADRKRLRRVVDSLDVPAGMGLIIRTAGAKRTKAEIKRDYDYLIRLWENIRALTLKSIAPCLIYEEASLIKRAIRDLYDKDISEVLVEGETGYREAKDFMKMLMPSHAKNIQPYKDKAPLFLKTGAESQLDAMYQPVVRLRSGGYLVIHQTEALIAIDVNSGKATRERNIELTALKTNLEAAREAARQFRLRDLAGLIVIDFIDMEENRNNRAVEKALKDALKTDRARIQVGRISNFGLLEMSRQRRRSGIVDGTTDLCPTCSGSGAVRSDETAALRILRAIEAEALAGRHGVLQAKTSMNVALYILNHKRDWLNRLEREYGVAVEITADASKAGDHYEIEKRGVPRDTADAGAHVRADTIEAAEADAPEAASVDDAPDGQADSQAEGQEGEGSGRKRRRRRRRRRDERDEASASEGPAQAGESDDADDAQDSEGDGGDETDSEKSASDDAGEAGAKRRRRRGRRGGRRNRKTRDQDEAEGSSADEEEGDTATAADESVDADLLASAKDGETESGDDASDAEPDAAEPMHEDELPAPAAHVNGDEKLATATDAPESGSGPMAEDEAALEPEPAALPADTAPSGPPRKGWWQRAIGG